MLFDGKRAIGVTYLVGDSEERVEARARKEVIVSSGAIASPQLLQRSGVGPRELLESLDIPVVHDLPGVGENLQDHGAVPAIRVHPAGFAVPVAAVVEPASHWR